jgi:hypothetical protein
MGLVRDDELAWMVAAILSSMTLLVIREIV